MQDDIMSCEKEYLAFISYNHKDKDWARWLQEWIESYKVPVFTKGLQGVPPKPWRVFRDETDLGVGEDLDKEIPAQLIQSRFLIVICSPNAVKSSFVELEISTFLELDKDNRNRIIPFIVKGKPDSGRKNECFPAPLRKTEFKNILAANVNEISKEYAAIKVLAKMFGNIKPDRLWQRHLVFAEEEKRRIIEQRNKLFRIQSNFLVEKSLNLLERGDSYRARLVALEALPQKRNDPEDRPFVVEAEIAFRKACQINQTHLIGHKDKVSAIAYSSDGCYLASASLDKTIRIWELNTGRCILVINVKDRNRWYPAEHIIASLAWHNNRIVAGFADNLIMVWDAQTGEPLSFIDCQLKLYSTPEVPEVFLDLYRENLGVMSVAINDTLMVSGHKNASICIWDMKTGELVNSMFFEYKTFEEMYYNMNYVNCVSVSSDGKMVASAYNDGIVRVWDVENEDCFSLEGHTERVLSVAFSSDGRRVLSSSADCTIRIWSLETRQCVNVLKGHDAEVYSANYSLDGSQIVSVSMDHTIRFWSALDGKCIRRLETRGFSTPISKENYYPDSKEIEYETQRSKKEFFEKHKCIPSYNPCGNSICVVYDDDIRLFDANPCYRLYPLINSFNGRIIILSRDGKYFLTSKGDVYKRFFFDGRLEKQTHLKGKILDIDGFVVGLNEKYLLTVRVKEVEDQVDDDLIKVWDFRTKNFIRDIEIKGRVRFVDFSSYYESRFVTISWEDEICIWDIDVDSPVIFHDDGAKIAAFSPDSNQFATTDSSNICIWNIPLNKCEYIIPAKGKINSLEYSSDGRCLLSASNDRNVYMWDLFDKGKSIRVFSGHKEDVLFAHFSLDNKYVLSVSYDNTIRVWEVETCDCVSVMDCDNGIHSAYFSQDGKRVVSLFLDGTIRIWDFPPLQELIDQTRERFKDRPLTPEERHQYYLE